MANYYDWNPAGKDKDKKPSVEANDQPESLPPAPPEELTSAAPVESQAVVVNQWSSDALAVEPPSLPDEDDTSAPIDAEDELHPMYRVVSAMLDVDERAEEPATPSVVEADVVEVPVEPAPSTATLADALREEGTDTDADFPPLPTRIDELTQAIERYPQSPANYVLRGEAHWDEGRGREAAKDFLAALKLAESRDTTWEFLNRSFLDRARQGLRRCGYEINGTI